MDRHGLTAEARSWAAAAVWAWSRRRWDEGHDAALRVALCLARLRDMEG
jgi:hypothetical protein